MRTRTARGYARGYWGRFPFASGQRFEGLAAFALISCQTSFAILTIWLHPFNLRYTLSPAQTSITRSLTSGVSAGAMLRV